MFPISYLVDPFANLDGNELTASKKQYLNIIPIELLDHLDAGELGL